MIQIRNFIRLAAVIFGVAAACSAQTGFPWQSETLRYSITWQSGLSLGDASLSAHKTDKGWEFEAVVNAGVPGFAIADRVRSSTGPDLCSNELERDFSHGAKKTREKTAFDQHNRTAERTTLQPDGGTKPGKSTFDIPSCARDALAFLYYSRMELGQGRVTPPQRVWLGSEYSVRTDYTGAQDITLGKKPVVADHIVVTVKGPKSDFNFEVFYARDPQRTPLQIRIPLTLGTFTLELVR